jgi:poly(A) polymerase
MLPIDILPEIPSMTNRDFALKITKQLQNAGFQALWAGGCVRDDLLGIEPTDFDIATNATPNQIRDLFGHRRTLAIGAAFGVITVVAPKPLNQIEVATFRRDGDYSDGRHPDRVEFTDAREDARRRDFTINGMFFDPIKGEVIDYVDGQNDLHNKLIRAIGNPSERIHEDKLRMLRAVRFAARFNYTIEPSTFDSIREQCHEITCVSGERIAAEFEKMLVLPGRALAIELLAQTGLNDILLPELAPVMASDDSKTLLFGLLQRMKPTEFGAGLARLIFPCPNPAEVIQRIAQDWRLSNETVNQDQFIVDNCETVQNAHLLNWSRVQPLVIHPWFALLLDFAFDVAITRHQPSDGIVFCTQQLKLDRSVLDPPPFIDGNSLKEVGISPGPVFKEILQSVRDQQLDGMINNREQAFDLAMKIHQSSQN